VLNREDQADFVTATTCIGGIAGGLHNISSPVLLALIAQFSVEKVLKLLRVILVVFGWNTRRKTPFLVLDRLSYQISLSFLNTSVIFLITSSCAYLS
jgi:hypothetical protein